MFPPIQNHILEALMDLNDATEHLHGLGPLEDDWLTEERALIRLALARVEKYDLVESLRLQAILQEFIN